MAATTKSLTILFTFRNQLIQDVWITVKIGIQEISINIHLICFYLHMKKTSLEFYSCKRQNKLLLLDKTLPQKWQRSIKEHQDESNYNWI